MAAVWQGLGAVRGRRSHQMLTEESPDPGSGKLPASSLDSLCTRLSRRLPLGVLDANFQDGPSWEPLRGSGKAQGAGCSARKALGSMAQVPRTGLPLGQSGPVMPTQMAVLADLMHLSATENPEVMPGKQPEERPGPCPRREPTPKEEEEECPAVSGSLAKLQGPAEQCHLIPGLRAEKALQVDHQGPLFPLRRRSQREAALRSPYSSPAPLCSTRGGCSEEEEEPVATGIQQLKHLSQAFDEAIATDERKQAIAHYCLLMTHNLRAVCQSERCPWASGWRHARGLATNVKV